MTYAHKTQPATINHSHGGRLIVEHNQDTHNVRKFDGYLFLIKRQAQDRYLWVVFNGDGAEEARGAHNSEVLGSSPSSRIFLVVVPFLFLVISLNESIQDIERKYTYASIKCFYI